MKYIYYMSCATSDGFCSMEVTLNKKITKMSEIVNATKTIKKSFDRDDLMVINYQLLRTIKK